MSDLDKHFSTKIVELKSKKLLRSIRNYSDKLLDFSSNDYLGLKKDEEIKSLAKQAIDKYGVGAGASRLLTGNSPLYDELESSIANYHAKQSACVFSSGYAANIGSIPALVGKGDLIIADKLSHSCIIEGAKLSDAKLIRYSHNDYSHLEKLLSQNRGKYTNCLLVTEAVFSMDGDRADIAKLNVLAKKYKAWTFVDYAHEITPSEVKPDVVMGTFSKAFASLGGYVCANGAVIDYIKTKAKSLIYSTALPSSVLATSIASVKRLSNNSNLAKQSIENANYFSELMGITKSNSQIVPIIIGSEKAVLDTHKELESEGFIVSAIRPPTVPKGTSRLRFSFSASHTKEQIEKLAKAVKTVL